MVLEIAVADVSPDRNAVLSALDVPAHAGGRPRIEELTGAALRAFAETAAPQAVVADVSPEAFAALYQAAPGSAPDAVVGGVARRAEALALFVVTLGAPLSARIARCFAERDYALGAALDAAASEGADRAAEAVQRRVEGRLRDEGRLGEDGAALRYSPGYCGWHVSGQAPLFRRLAPERIGVRLTESGFMTPEKSVSGVILAGAREIHRVTPSFSFCPQCTTRSCVARTSAVLGQAPRSASGGAA